MAWHCLLATGLLDDYVSKKCIFVCLSLEVDVCSSVGSHWADIFRLFVLHILVIGFCVGRMFSLHSSFLRTPHSHDLVPAPFIGKRLESSLMKRLTSGGRTLPVIHNRYKQEDKSTIKKKNKHLKNIFIHSETLIKDLLAQPTKQQGWTYFWSYSAFTVTCAFWTFSKSQLLLL